MNERNSNTLWYIIGGGIAAWLVARWAEDRWGQDGDIGIALVGVLLVALAISVGLGWLFVNAFKSGVVTANNAHQQTHENNTRIVESVSRPATAQARLEQQQLVNQRETYRQTPRLAEYSSASQPQYASQPVEDEIDADYWRVNIDADAIRFDE